ncbi:MAG: hypothetical protein IJY04_09880 [Clostridia bacterium]|nr:hypothetical protein [Clostridia bacterium]
MKKYKLSRMFSLFAPRSLILVIAWVAVTVLFGMKAPESDIGNRGAAVIVASVIGFILVILFLVSETPYELRLSEKRLYLSKVVFIRPHGIMSGSYMRRVHVRYCASDIRNVSFSQSFPERLFGVGRVKISGSFRVEAERDADRIAIPREMTVYGIKDFFAFKQELLALLEE